MLQSEAQGSCGRQTCFLSTLDSLPPLHSTSELNQTLVAPSCNEVYFLVAPVLRGRLNAWPSQHGETPPEGAEAPSAPSTGLGCEQGAQHRSHCPPHPPAQQLPVSKAGCDIRRKLTAHRLGRGNSHSRSAPWGSCGKPSH